MTSAASATGELIIGEWFGGKAFGAITERATHYLVRFRRGSHGEVTADMPTKCFTFSKYASKEQARVAAEAYHREMSNSHGLTRNRLRHVEDGKTAWMEMELQELDGVQRIAKFDAADLETIMGLSGRFAWFAQSGERKTTEEALARRRYYVYNGTGHSLHTMLCTQWSEVDHINRNGLDNRRVNLRDGRGVNMLNRRIHGNRSGKVGVSRNGIYWSVQWVEEGKHRSKHFSTRRLGDDEARRQAVEFRRAADIRTGNRNGYASEPGESGESDTEENEQDESDQKSEERNV